MVKDTRKQVVIKLQNDEYERLLAAAEARGTSLYKFCLDSMRRDLLGIQADTQPASHPSPQAIDSETLASLVDTRVAEVLATQPIAPDPALASTVAELLARVEALEKPDGAIAQPNRSPQQHRSPRPASKGLHASKAPTTGNGSRALIASR